MDAQVAYGFHHLRNEKPYLAHGPIANKVWLNVLTTISMCLIYALRCYTINSRVTYNKKPTTVEFNLACWAIFLWYVDVCFLNLLLGICEFYVSLD